MNNKLRAGVLGATGMVGQHYVRLLTDHPFFEVSFLAASPESAGKRYADALMGKGRASDAIPASTLALPVHHIEDIAAARQSCDFVFSAVDAAIASTFEPLYAKAGLPVVSNASAHRMDDDVPCLIPEVNPDHLDAIAFQKKNRGWEKGFIVAKPNCSLQSYVIPLYPLHVKFRIKTIVLTTMQALSGAGYPGISSLDMIDNLIPYINGEEEKSQQEPLKLLGAVRDGKICPDTSIAISAHCNRVPVLDGHTACVSVAFENKPARGEILELWQNFKSLDLPSAPNQLIVYREENNRPQPRLDRDAAGGMAVTVGRLRECPVLDYRFVALSHNALRGAASGGILNAELLYRRGFLS